MRPAVISRTLTREAEIVYEVRLPDGRHGAMGAVRWKTRRPMLRARVHVRAPRMDASRDIAPRIRLSGTVRLTVAGSGGDAGLRRLRHVPGQKLVQPVDRMTADSGEDLS